MIRHVYSQDPFRILSTPRSMTERSNFRLITPPVQKPAQTPRG